MKKTKKSGLLILAMLLCLGMTACSGPENEDEDVIAGDDWRTYGLVVGSGTITRDGENTDVLVAVDEESAAFFWDEPTQVLYDSVDFPMAIPDARETFSDISFEDLDGDGKAMCGSASRMKTVTKQSLPGLGIRQGSTFSGKISPTRRSAPGTWRIM